ncbi:hypothetical protein O6H91_06G090200 [Diphasiastrum complanatum]|uniref:Uncharacterized protein n=1 Tax=Diphasiastrum complanatum TaxID=34168 RepID=A0ACC2DGL2_DIPCM|nr:hypothetical protein O6H91_06G090200 [Diphasiastrum complanatum]
MTMPFVVDFYATWCGPCITMAHEVELLAVEYVTRVSFLKVDTDEEYQLAHQMEVRGLPTLVFISSDPKEPAHGGHTCKICCSRRYQCKVEST